MRENTYLQRIKNFLYNEVLMQEKQIRETSQKLKLIESRVDEDLAEKLQVGIKSFPSRSKEIFTRTTSE